MQTTKDKVEQTNLTPATLVFLVEAETHPAVIGHLLAPVDQHVNVVRIVQRLRLAPDDGEGGGDVGRPRRVGELHLVAVDGVTQQLSIHTGHPTLYVELADKPEHQIVNADNGIEIFLKTWSG